MPLILAGNLVLAVADPGAQDTLKFVPLEDAVGPNIWGVGVDLEEAGLAHVDLHRGRSAPAAQPVLELVDAGLRANEAVEVVGEEVDAHVDAGDVEAEDGADPILQGAKPENYRVTVLVTAVHFSLKLAIAGSMN